MSTAGSRLVLICVTSRTRGSGLGTSDQWSSYGLQTGDTKRGRIVLYPPNAGQAEGG